MTTNLKPCPFCGGTDLYWDPEICSILCESCIACGPTSLMKEIAEKRWNQRMTNGKLPEWLKTELINAVCCATDDETKGWNDAIGYVLSLKKPDGE